MPVRFLELNNPDLLLGLELDDVLDGPEVVPEIDPPDRRSQVVLLPPLTADELAFEHEQRDILSVTWVRAPEARPNVWDRLEERRLAAARRDATRAEAIHRHAVERRGRIRELIRERASSIGLSLEDQNRLRMLGWSE